jgi:putative PEP-CTERM system TPR-repeat lipoprotein
VRIIWVSFRVSLICILYWLMLGCDNSTVVDHVQAARDSLAKGEMNVAIIELKNALQKDRSSGEARSLLGQAYLQVGDLPSAFKELERAINLGMADDDTAIALLKTKNALGRFAEVIDELKDRADLSSEYAVVLANAYLIAGDLEHAKPLLQRGSDLPSGMLGLARVAQYEHDLDRAHDYLTRLVEKFPRNRDGWLLKGEVELSQGNAADALASFQEVSKLAGIVVSGELGIIRARILAGDLDEAEKEVDVLLRRLPVFAPAQYLKALISFMQQDLDAAENALRIVEQNNPDHLPTLFLMGGVKLEQGEPKEAESYLKRYMQQDGNNVSVIKLLASAYYAQGKMSDVVATLGPVTEQSSDPQLWAMLGSAYMRSGDMAAAASALQKAVEIAPNMAAFRNQLAIGLLSVGQDEQAMAQLNSAVKVDEDQFQSDYIEVMLKLREGDLAGAGGAVEKLIVKSADIPIGYNIKGTIAYAQNDVPVAVAAFEKALAVDPSYFPAAKNLARIAEKAGDMNRVRALFEGVLQADPNSEQATLALADLVVRQGDAAKGLEMTNAAVNRFPKSVNAKLGQIRLLVAQGRIQEAKQAATIAVGMIDNDPDLLLLEADIDLRTGDTTAAQKAAGKLQGLLGRFHGDGDLLADVGTLQMQVGNLAIARKDLESATIGKKAPLRAQVSLVRLELIEGNHEAAQARVAQLLQKGAVDDEILLLQGDTMIAAGYQDKAREHFAKMAAQGSRSATSRFARLALQQGDMPAARLMLRGWVAKYPNDNGMKILLANLEVQDGAQDAAKLLYEAMLPTDNSVVLNNLAWIYMDEGDARAVEMARLANQAAPDNPDIEDTLGWILVSTGANQEGLIWLTRSIQARPDNASVQYHLGVAHYKIGNKKSAKIALEHALSLGEFEEADEARRLLAEM